jgi:hypothetical protein
VRGVSKMIVWLLLDEFAKYILRVDFQYRVLNRNKVNPIGKGCHLDTLISQDRKSEARIGYPHKESE